MTALSLLIIGLCLGPNASEAQIYRWKDEKGKYQFSDKPHPGAELISSGKASKVPVIQALEPLNNFPKPAQGASELVAKPHAVPNMQTKTAPLKLVETPSSKPVVMPQSSGSPIAPADTMSEADKERLRELSRKHRRCAASRNRLSKLQSQLHQRKQQGAPQQTLDYLNRSVIRQDKIVERDCQ
ncbi:MAG: DUF4124 domain-containing protein [Cellvibrionaceae bacterium]|nr:DUF4124 domain-containing protein [Cellvibrionaceae bacterium]